MSLQNITDSGMTVPCGFQEVNFAAPFGPQMEFQNLKTPPAFQTIVDEKGAKWKNDGKLQDLHRRKAGDKLCARGHWRPHEDAKLKELVTLYGPQNWNLIAEKLEGRSGKSCRLRWFNQLDPRINRRAFTEDEEERLLVAHRMYGNKWAMISRLFPGRTDNAVKNHWHVIMARKHREENSVYRRRKPPNFQASHRGFSKNTREKNACNESNISSDNIDGSASTCTILSLAPSSTRVYSFFLSSFSNSEFQPFGSQRAGKGSSKAQDNVTQVRRVIQNQLYRDRPIAKAAPSNPSGQSDSNSEVSASESVACTEANLRLYHKVKNGSENCEMPFIDFLGVGAS